MIGAARVKDRMVVVSRMKYNLMRMYVFESVVQDSVVVLSIAMMLFTAPSL